MTVIMTVIMAVVVAVIYIDSFIADITCIVYLYCMWKRMLRESRISCKKSEISNQILLARQKKISKKMEYETIEELSYVDCVKIIDEDLVDVKCVCIEECAANTCLNIGSKIQFKKDVNCNAKKCLNKYFSVGFKNRHYFSILDAIMVIKYHRHIFFLYFVMYLQKW